MRSTSSKSSRSARAKRVGLVVSLGLILTLVFSACRPTADEQQAIDLLNASRMWSGIGSLTVDDSLQTKANRHAREMASGQSLFHSSLAAGVRGGWESLGENVGVGPTLDSVNVQFDNSPNHRDRRVSDQWNAVGVGVARDAEGRYWVVEEFGRF